MLERLRLGQPALSAIVCLMLACPTAASCQVEPSTQTNTAINGPVGTANNPLKVSSGIMAGRLINREMPVYPASEGPYKSGAVVLRATITPEGKVGTSLVVIFLPRLTSETSTGSGATLDLQALSTQWNCRLGSDHHNVTFGFRRIVRLNDRIKRRPSEDRTSQKVGVFGRFDRSSTAGSWMRGLGGRIHASEAKS